MLCRAERTTFAQAAAWLHAWPDAELPAQATARAGRHLGLEHSGRPIGMTGSLSTMGITGLMATEDVQQFVPPPSDTLYIPTVGAIEPQPEIDYMAGVQVEFAQPWQPPEPVGPVRQRVLDEAHYYASIKPQGPTVNVTMPQVGGTIAGAPAASAQLPDDFFRDIEILPGGMALPGSPLDNFLDWVREGFREAPGNYYGDAQLAAMQQERLAGMGPARRLGRGPIPLSSTVAPTTRIPMRAGRTFLGGRRGLLRLGGCVDRAWGRAGGQCRHEFARRRADYLGHGNWGKLDDPCHCAHAGAARLFGRGDGLGTVEARAVAGHAGSAGAARSAGQRHAADDSGAV